MDFTNLREHYRELLDYLEEDGYTESYIRAVRYNIQWILKHEKHKPWQSYLDAYHDRIGKTESELHKKNHKIAFGAIQQFDLYGEYPNRRVKNSFIKRGAYHHLIPEFKELIDYYRESDKAGEIKESTAVGNASNASAFLYEIQKRGINSLERINEEDALSFFLDNEGKLCKGSSYKKNIAAVFRVAAERKPVCQRILAYLPQIRPKRKNIPFFAPEEVEAIRSAIDDESSAISLRDRAIGKLLFFTGMRACDIADMRLNSINWENDEIYISQQKTEQPLVLPLTATVGNSIYDYLVNERPESEHDHLFLGANYPHYPFEAGAVWSQSAKIYREAAIRQDKGDRRGSHLFRHNVATSFLGSGVPRPVISQTLGHADPLSLEPYLHADIANLRKCALSIEGFPASEEVFRL